MNAIYARQSIEKKDSLSIEGQVELCRRISGDSIVFKDVGYSGKNTNRPALKQLVEAIKKGQITKIYVYRIDRFSRSISDFSKLWDLLEKYGVEFISVSESFDTSVPIGRAMLNIVMTFAQLERETTAERVKDNYMHRFLKGAWPGGPAPFGYKLKKVCDEDGNKISVLEVDTKASETVKLIFEKYSCENTSLSEIAEYLNFFSIKKTNRTPWNSVAVSRILHNAVYVKADMDIYAYFISKGVCIDCDINNFVGINGCIMLNSCKKLSLGRHMGIIEPDMWLFVQDKLIKNTQISNLNAGKYSWLSGVLKCNKCGYAIKLNYNKSNNKIYLLCSGKSNYKICDNTIKVDISELESMVFKKLKNILDLCNDIACCNLKSNEILEIEKKLHRLTDAVKLCDGKPLKCLVEEIKLLETELESITKHNMQSKCSIDFSECSFEIKKLITTYFIDKIFLGGNSAEIKWNI